jgi:hypothetical protein
LRPNPRPPAAPRRRCASDHRQGAGSRKRRGRRTSGRREACCANASNDQSKGGRSAVLPSVQSTSPFRSWLRIRRPRGGMASRNSLRSASSSGQAKRVSGWLRPVSLPVSFQRSHLHRLILKRVAPCISPSTIWSGVRTKAIHIARENPTAANCALAVPQAKAEHPNHDEGPSDYAAITWCHGSKAESNGI